VKGMLSKQMEKLRQPAAMLLRQGITPRRLALTLALGFVIGCFPVVGAPTALCALLAVSLRLNLPVIQAANYLVMPLQLVLMVPSSAWAVGLSHGQRQPVNFSALLHLSRIDLMKQVGAYTGHALVAG